MIGEKHIQANPIFVDSSKKTVFRTITRLEYVFISQITFFATFHFKKNATCSLFLLLST